MLFTLAAVVFLAAIVTFFSQEFIGVFKKIWAIKGAKLILPLLLASWFILSFNYWVLWIIYYYREILNAIVKGLIYIIPLGQISVYVAYIIVLTVVSIVPVLCFDWFYRKKHYKSYPYPYLTSTIIWLFTAMALVVLWK